MTERRVSLSPTKWFAAIVTIIAVTNIAILLDIPVLRQISGFIFLTFVPGFLLLSVLKLNKLGFLEKIVLSVGLSVAFLMLFGLALNASLLAIGYTKPLSTISLLISFSAATIILAIIAYIRNKDITFSFSNLKLTTGEKAFLIVPALFPLISIVGMRLMNLTDNNVILMLLLFLIPAYVIFISFSNRKVSEKVYPAAIFLIGISLLLMYSLRSNHIIGADTNREFAIFLTTLDNLHWRQLGLGILDSCLSISLLPAIYQAFLNIDPEYLFKIVYSLIVSTLPLVIYLLSKKYVGSFYAFLTSVFFMSQIWFLWTPATARVNIALLFFALALMVLFSDNIGEFGKRTLFIVFTACIIVSHYGATYVAFFALLFTWIGMQVLSSIIASRTKKLAAISAKSRVVGGTPPNFSSQEESPSGIDATAYKATGLQSSQPQFRRGITAISIALFLTILFFWFSQMTGPSFSVGVKTIYTSIASWHWFLAEEAVSSRPVQAAFGRTLPYTGVPQRIEFVFSWLTIILMSIGLLLVTLRRVKTMVSNPHSEREKPNFSLKQFETEYLMLSIGCYLLLVATVLVPHVEEAYGSARVYFQMMAPLSIFFVIGGIMVARYLKSRPYWIILVVLLPYFLCTTGAICQVFGFPRAITLNSANSGGPPGIFNMYIYEEESCSAKWLKEYAGGEATIYIGSWATILVSQARIPEGQHKSFIATYQEGKQIDGYIYLRYLDIVDRELVAKYPGLFAQKSKIYTNGGSEVYK